MCLIWRQHRGQALWVGLTLASICALALGVSWSASHWLAGYHQWVKALADAGCPPPDAHSGDFHVRSAATCNTLRGLYSGAQQPAFVARYNFTVLVFEDGFPAALAIIGVLVGAPLVAREVEQRTQLASWTQSVSRRRWYVMKVTVLAASLAAVGLAAGIANARLQRSLGSGGLISSRWVWFFSTNFALVGEILLAFALGVAFGAWLRRTLAAAGAGIASFLVLLFATGWAVRTLTRLSKRSARRSTCQLGVGAYHSRVPWGASGITRRANTGPCSWSSSQSWGSSSSECSPRGGTPHAPEPCRGTARDLRINSCKP
jgi:hypothetical protein